MLPGVAEFVIQGVTVDGEAFQRPGWAQELCARLGTDADGQPLYPSFVHAVKVGGMDAVVVRVSLQLVDEKAFEAIKQFVAEHRLQVRAGRGSRDAESAAHVPERRSPENNDW